MCRRVRYGENALYHGIRTANPILILPQSVTAIMTFILAILKNPDKQRRAQEEIDAVVGTDRLPNLSDMDDLPYVQAICTEVFRYVCQHSRLRICLE